jgi:hypothetical protein
MTSRVSVTQAKANFSALVARTERGEEIVLIRFPPKHFMHFGGKVLKIKETF